MVKVSGRSSSSYLLPPQGWLPPSHVICQWKPRASEPWITDGFLLGQHLTPGRSNFTIRLFPLFKLDWVPDSPLCNFTTTQNCQSNYRKDPVDEYGLINKLRKIWSEWLDICQPNYRNYPAKFGCLNKFRKDDSMNAWITLWWRCL